MADYALMVRHAEHGMRCHENSLCAAGQPLAQQLNVVHKGHESYARTRCKEAAIVGEPGYVDGAEVVGEGGEQLGRVAAQLLLHVQHRQQVPDPDLVV